VPLVPCYFNAIMVMRRRTPPGAVLAGGAAKTAVYTLQPLSRGGNRVEAGSPNAA
jgi:hypothetical protein